MGEMGRVVKSGDTLYEKLTVYYNFLAKCSDYIQLGHIWHKTVAKLIWRLATLY